MRNPRYRISFAYVLPTKEKTILGKLDEKVFTYEEVDYIMKILSPFKAMEYLPVIRNMNRNGVLRFSFDEYHNGDLMKKIVKIVRN